MTTTPLESPLPYAHPFHAAFHTTAPERAALAESDVLPINLDVQVAATTVLGVIGQLNSLRADIATHLQTMDIATFDKIENYARALAYAQTAYLAASASTDALPDLADKAFKLRDLLMSDARALAKRNLIDGKRVADLKGGPGYLNIASDLGVLVRILRERWADIGAKSAIQPQELDEAEQAFELITLAYAQRSGPSMAVTHATTERLRAYTLLVNAYDQARRAAIYLRWAQGDADKLVPSLWAGRGGRGARNADADGDQSEAAPPGASVSGSKDQVGDVGAPDHAPVNGGAPLGSFAGVTPGLPGGSPFAAS